MKYKFRMLLIICGFILCSCGNSSFIKKDMTFEEVLNKLSDDSGVFICNKIMLINVNQYNYVCTLDEYKGKIVSVKEYEEVTPTFDDLLDIKYYKDDLYDVVEKLGFCSGYYADIDYYESENNATWLTYLVENKMYGIRLNYEKKEIPVVTLIYHY